MNKLEFINSYIERCDEILAVNDYDAARNIQTEIISTFEPEIKNITNELDNYSMLGFYQPNRKVDFLGDLKLLKQKLQNHFFNIQEEEKLREHELEMARLSQPILNASAEASQVVSNNIYVSFQCVLETVDKFESEKLSDDDKDIIKELMYSLEGVKATKNREKIWNKSKDVLKFLIDKGIDVAIAVLPYIMNGLV